MYLKYNAKTLINDVFRIPSGAQYIKISLQSAQNINITINGVLTTLQGGHQYVFPVCNASVYPDVLCDNTPGGHTALLEWVI